MYPYHPHGNNAENCRFRSKWIPCQPGLSQRVTPSPLPLWLYSCLFADVYTVYIFTYKTLNSTRPHLSVQPSPLPSNLLSCLSTNINLIYFIFPLFPVMHNLTALPVLSHAPSSLSFSSSLFFSPSSLNVSLPPLLPLSFSVLTNCLPLSPPPSLYPFSLYLTLSFLLVTLSLSLSSLFSLLCSLFSLLSSLISLLASLSLFMYVYT